MEYSVRWDEFERDYLRHVFYQRSVLSRWMSVPIVIAFIAEAIVMIKKEEIAWCCVCLFFAVFTVVINGGYWYLIKKEFAEKLEGAGADHISYEATVTAEKIIINNITEDTSSVRNYNSIWKTCEKDFEILIEVDHEYICIDRKRYSEDFQTELKKFINKNIETRDNKYTVERRTI